MPHVLSVENLDALSAPVVKRTVLVRLDFPAGVVAVHPGAGSFAWDGDTYLGIGEVGKMSSVEESADAKPRAMTFALSGLSNDLLTKVNAAGYRGRDVDVYYLLFDLETQQPVGDPWIAWSGYMDTLRYSVGPERFDLTLTAESILIKLRRRNTRRRTNEDQQKLYPGDPFFEFVDQLRFHKIELGGERFGGSSSGRAPGRGGREGLREV